MPGSIEVYGCKRHSGIWIVGAGIGRVIEETHGDEDGWGEFAVREGDIEVLGGVGRVGGH